MEIQASRVCARPLPIEKRQSRGLDRRACARQASECTASRWACISGAVKKKPDVRQAARRAPPWSVAETEAPLALVLDWGELLGQHKKEVSQRTTSSCAATKFEWALVGSSFLAAFALVSCPRLALWRNRDSPLLVFFEVTETALIRLSTTGENCDRQTNAATWDRIAPAGRLRNVTRQSQRII